MSRFPLEPDASDMLEMVDRAMERVVEHIESLPSQPAWNTEGGAALALSQVERSVPEEASPFPTLLDQLFHQLIPRTFNTASPGYLAFIPGGGIFHTAVADLIASAVNRYVGVWAAAPGLARLEANVVDWFCSLCGLPETSGGILTTGGSVSTWVAVTTARINRLPENFLSGTVYCSGQIHHSVLKAMRLAGFPDRNVRSVAIDDRFRIDPMDLREQIQRDRAQGLTPFLICGSAGTTNTGAVDDLVALANLAEQEGLWLHVDAAYGGFFQLTSLGRERLRGLDRADSITLDPHKALFLPYGTGTLLVRNRQTLRRAHSFHGDYMPDMQDDPSLVDFCEISPELSRGFRGLRIWLPIKLLGIGPFRQALEEKLELTDWILGRLKTLPDIEIVAEPQLTVIAFRLHPEGLSPSQLNQLNREFLKKINEPARVYLTATELDGRFVLRICVLSFRTHQDRMEMAWEDLLAARLAVLGEDPDLASCLSTKRPPHRSPRSTPRSAPPEGHGG